MNATDIPLWWVIVLWRYQPSPYPIILNIVTSRIPAIRLIAL